MNNTLLIDKADEYRAQQAESSPPSLRPQGLLEKVPVMLDRVGYQEKPGKGSHEWGGINARINAGRADVSVAELALHIGQGCTFSPAVFDGTRKNENWQAQQVYALDFDCGYQLDDFASDCHAWGVAPAFVYPTFSHTGENHRFRAVFVAEVPIVDRRVRDMVQCLLRLMFTKGKGIDRVEPDPACDDPARLFLGTNMALTHKDFEARVNPMALLHLYLRHLKRHHETNFARKAEQLANRLGILFRHQKLGVQVIEYDFPTIYENTVGVFSKYTQTVNSYNFNEAKSSILKWNGQVCQIFWNSQNKVHSTSITPKHTGRQESRNRTRTSGKRRLTIKDKEQLIARCCLLDEFMKGTRHLSHQERRLLLTNLRQREGGEKWYREGVAKRDDYRPDTLMEDAKRYDMVPEGCAHCRYAAECNHKTNLLQQLTPKRRECRRIRMPVQGASLEDTRTRLREALANCIQLKEPMVYVIRCDPGVGKTELLLELDLDGVCLASDTHKLKKEAYERLRQKGRNAYLWPQPPPLPPDLREALHRRQGVGLGGSVRAYRAALRRPEVYGSRQWAAAIYRYLQALRDVHRQARVMATHEKAYQLQSNPKLHTFIFDEDFTKTLVKVVEIPPADIIRFLEVLSEARDPALEGVCQYLKSVLSAPSRTTVYPPAPAYPRALFLQTLANAAPSLQSPIEALLRCVAYRKDSATAHSSESVYCIQREQIPTGKKYIVLSATADEWIYRHLFGERLVFIDLGRTALRGKLICHTRRGYSKHSIFRDRPGFARHVMEACQEFALDGVITHKMCAEERDGQMYLQGTCGKVPVLGTFGALQGLDSLSGLRLGIFGTPYPPEYAVALWAALLKVPVDPEMFTHEERPVEYGEFEFSMPTCSAHAGIQRIQLWLTVSELIQAAGRARLLQNDGEVHVFSAIPLPGSILFD